MCIILMLLSRPGSASRTVSGVPVRSGSMYFSRVERYLTLSLASLFASVIELSSSFHRLSTRDLAAPSCSVIAPSMRVRSCTRVRVSCSVRALSFELLLLAMRVRQYSSSVTGRRRRSGRRRTCRRR